MPKIWITSTVFYAYKTVSSVPATIGASGLATLYTSYALDFSGVSGLKAYTATLADKKVTLTPVDNVPAGTGVVLKGDEGNYDIPVIASSVTDKGALMGSATDIVYDAEAANDYYYLGLNEGKAQFKKLTSGTIAAGKCYLEVAKSSARTLEVVFADAETTGINSIENARVENGQFFNLAGQRVAKAQKGLYIVNGKKYVVK